jgi:hypothetical protein
MANLSELLLFVICITAHFLEPVLPNPEKNLYRVTSRLS